MSSKFDEMFDEIAQSSNSKKSNFDQLFDEEQQKQPSRLRSLISAPIKGALKSAQSINPFSFSPFSRELGENIIEEFLPTQQKNTEKILERGGKLAPYVVGGGEGLALKGLQIGAGALSGHLAEEAGLGEVGQGVSEIISMSFPGLLKSLGMKAYNLAKKGITKASGEALAKISKLKPNEIKVPIRESAKRLGVLENLPISAQVTNPVIQSTETKLFQSTSGKRIQEKVERLGEDLVKTYEDVGNQISKRRDMLPSVISEEATLALKNAEEASENIYNSLYAQSEKFLPESATTTPKIGTAINKIIDSTQKKVKSDLGTASKDVIYNRLQRLKDNWANNKSIQEGYIPIHKLIELKKDLNQIIKYETKGGADKFLTKLQAVTKQAIQSYGRETNKNFLNRFNQAEKIFGENAQTFRKNPIIRTLVEGKNPELIFSKMNTVKGIRDLEKIFNKTTNGKEIFDAIKKYKLEDLLNDKVLDKNGNISWGKSAGMLKDPKTRDLVIELVGKEQYNRLKDLSKVANGVEEGFKKFINNSKTAVTMMDMALLVGLPIKAAQQLFSGNILGAAKTVSAVMVPHQFSKLISNPEFVDAAIKTAIAGKSNNGPRFLKNAMKVAQFTAAAMLEKGSNKEESMKANQ